MSVADELAKLASLRADGVLSYLSRVNMTPLMGPIGIVTG